MLRADLSVRAVRSPDRFAGLPAVCAAEGKAAGQLPKIFTP